MAFTNSQSVNFENVPLSPFTQNNHYEHKSDAGSNILSYYEGPITPLSGATRVESERHSPRPPIPAEWRQRSPSPSHSGWLFDEGAKLPQWGNIYEDTTWGTDKEREQQVEVPYDWQEALVAEDERLQRRRTHFPDRVEAIQCDTELLEELAACARALSRPTAVFAAFSSD